MPEQDLSFEGFLESVDLPYQEFVTQVNDAMLESGCKLKLQTGKSGYVVSYLHGKNKRVVLNFVFRKIGLLTRIYGDNAGQYAEFMNTLPETMVKSIDKASECKACNSRCLKGYDFAIKDKQYNRCRYNSFLFPVNDEGMPFIRGFLENEMRARNA